MKLVLKLVNTSNQFDLEDEYELFDLTDVKALEQDIQWIKNFLQGKSQISPTTEAHKS